MDPREASRESTGWHEAFSALPLETPPGDGWSRLAPALPRRRARPKPAPWLAAAAVAGLVAAPAWWLMHTPPGPPARLPAPAAVSIPQQPAPHLAATPPPGRAGAGAVASVPQPAEASDPANTAARAPSDARMLEEIEHLHGESARLEALLAKLSGDADADAMHLALSSGLQARVETIDASLSTSGLTTEVRTELWRQRVDVLGQLATVAAQQRWDALYGRGATDYALVQVY